MPAPREHHLKCIHDFFDSVWMGIKPFELRKDDRGFSVGDLIVLHETQFRPGRPARWIKAEITYLLGGAPWLAPEYVALGIRVFERGGHVEPRAVN